MTATGTIAIGKNSRMIVLKLRPGFIAVIIVEMPRNWRIIQMFPCTRLREIMIISIRIGDVTLVNPGSIALPRDGRYGTYALCCLENRVIKEVRFFKIL